VSTPQPNEGTANGENQRLSKQQLYWSIIAAVAAILAIVTALFQPEFRYWLLPQASVTIAKARLFTYTYHSNEPSVLDPSNPYADATARANEVLFDSLGAPPPVEKRAYDPKNHFNARTGDRLYLEVTLLHQALTGKHRILRNLTYRFPVTQPFGDSLIQSKTLLETFNGFNTRLIIPLDALGTHLTSWPKGRYELTLSIEIDQVVSKDQIVEFSIE
jgi:hypothetical protein